MIAIEVVLVRYRDNMLSEEITEQVEVADPGENPIHEFLLENLDRVHRDAVFRIVTQAFESVRDRFISDEQYERVVDEVASAIYLKDVRIPDAPYTRYQVEVETPSGHEFTQVLASSPEEAKFRGLWAALVQADPFAYDPEVYAADGIHSFRGTVSLMRKLEALEVVDVTDLEPVNSPI